MGVLAAHCCEVPMQEGTLTADGATHKLHCFSQLSSKNAAPVHKRLSADAQQVEKFGNFC